MTKLCAVCGKLIDLKRDTVIYTSNIIGVDGELAHYPLCYMQLRTSATNFRMPPPVRGIIPPNTVKE